jgi:hypothetical protein
MLDKIYIIFLLFYNKSFFKKYPRGRKQKALWNWLSFFYVWYAKRYDKMTRPQYWKNWDQATNCYTFYSRLTLIHLFPLEKSNISRKSKNNWIIRKKIWISDFYNGTDGRELLFNNFDYNPNWLIHYCFKWTSPE